jgi:uroporphyrinogen decarboxylase
MMGDDFGTQTGMMFDINTWRKFFKPGFKAYIDLAHQFGLKVMHHTCGSVRDLIPDFIECGLDILQSIQPRAKGMDLAELKQEFGHALCFHGGFDIQQTLPYDTPEEIRSEVKRLFDAGKPHGGYIACTAHNIPPDTPTENILALFAAYQEYGIY